MEDLQTAVLDFLSDYRKNENKINSELNSSKESENVDPDNLLNGCEDLDDLMDHCENVSIASNSDVWKGSDSEDDNPVLKEYDSQKTESQTDKHVEKKTESEEKIEEKNSECVTQKDEEIQNIEKECDESKSENKSHEENVENKTDTFVDEENNENKTVGEENVIGTETPDNPKKKAVSAENQTVESIEILEAEQQNINSQQDVCPEFQQNVHSDSHEKEEMKKASVTEVQNEVEKSDETQIHSFDESTENVNSNKSDEEKYDGDDEYLDENTGIVRRKKKNEKRNDDVRQNLSVDKNAENIKQNENNGDKNEDVMQNESVDKNANSFRQNENKEEDKDDVIMDYDAEDDDDFDPSLLCPEVSMDVDENPVLTSNGPVSIDPGPEKSIPYQSTTDIEFNLTEEELNLKRTLYGPTNPIQYTKIHCTACNEHLGSALDGQNNRFVHPLLKVLICKSCYNFYTSGDFEKDEDGSELYCRWCGQGGQVLCCSKCEYVFCKKCIRINFGRKKMLDIRDSDCWECFRCNQSQIVPQRVACCEFFEYVRREVQNAPLYYDPDFWTKDYTRCCNGKKRALEGEEMKKAKKKKDIVDPDYVPSADKEGKESKPLNIKPVFNCKGVALTKQAIPFVKSVLSNKDNDVQFVRNLPPLKVGRPMPPLSGLRQEPVVSATRSMPAANVTINLRPTYRTIMPAPSRPVLNPAVVRISSQPVTSSPILKPLLISSSKNEWFHKTARASGRVSSHLSYTLTQLEKAQSQAKSVEELAVIHNKLQEILSGSINSLIQIRKNLRTEFIRGVRSAKLPMKNVESNDDDDVIIVSASTPSTSNAADIALSDPQIVIDKSPIVITNISDSSTKSYLKVKSMTELQTVPTECITIPDDLPQEKELGKVKIICNGGMEVKILSKEKDPLATDENETTVGTIDLSRVPNSGKEDKSTSLKFRDVKIRRVKSGPFVYNIKNEPTEEVRRMMAVEVRLPMMNLEAQKKMLDERARQKTVSK